MKIKRQIEIVGNLLDKLRKLYMNGTVINFWPSSTVIENSRQYLLLRTDILQKTVAGCPLRGVPEVLQC